jgi:tetratricopeptide (TPR) repeat protein
MRLNTITILACCCALSAQADDPRPIFQGRYLARIDSLGFDAYRSLGEKAQLERREESRRWVKRGNERRERALDEYATAVGVCPYVPEAWLRFGQAHLLRGFDEAAQWCAAAGLRTLRFEPHQDKRLGIEAELHQLVAQVEYNLANYEASLQALEQALKLRPNEREHSLLYARALGAVGRFTDARRVLVSFGPQHPAYAEAQGILGNIELAAERYEVARQAFTTAAKHGLRGAVFANDRGRLELAVADYPAAMEYLRSAIELRPDFMEARSNLAVAQRRAGDVVAAERTLLAAIELRPDYAPAQFNLAEILRESAAIAAPEQAQLLRERAREHYALALRYGYDPALVLERRAGLAAEGTELVAAEQDLRRTAHRAAIAPPGQVARLRRSGAAQRLGRDLPAKRGHRFGARRTANGLGRQPRAGRDPGQSLDRVCDGR